MELKNTNNGHSALYGIDWFTLILYLILVTAGALSIYAASYDFDNASIFDFNEFSGKQIRWIGLSFLLGFSLLLIDRRIYQTYAYPIYTAMLLLLAVTIVIAPNIKGSHSWLIIGPMSLQPAEFAKFATALALAKLFSTYNFSLARSRFAYARALAIIFLPMMLILLQNETGSALVYMSLFFVLYREGMSGSILLAALVAVVIFVVTVKYTAPFATDATDGQLAIYLLLMVMAVGLTAFNVRRIIIARNLLLIFLVPTAAILILNRTGVIDHILVALTAVLAVGCLYLTVEFLRHKLKPLIATAAAMLLATAFLFSVDYVFTDLLQPHQQMRIKVALGIEQDIKKYGYNVNQSKIAIGSGSLTGKGFLQGTQTKLKFVPEQHTDFIFCTIGEEEGFIGSVAVTAMFLMLILRIIFIAERQPTVFARVYAYCVASYLIFHFCINIGMVIGLCPVIGIPLPFFSYGGSSLWGFTFLLFILLRLDADRRLHH